MDKDIFNNGLIATRRLYSNEDYYQIVFKRTERIVSAVFYILSFIERDNKTETQVSLLEKRAMSVHQEIIASLELVESRAAEELGTLVASLLALESSVRLATAARTMTADVALTITTEIESLLRYLGSRYLAAEDLPLETKQALAETKKAKTSPKETTRRRSRPNIPAGDLSSDAVLVYSELSDRLTRIKTVLEAKPEATIKDLSDIITDVSSKTIQRDLNSLIEKGEVQRHGERRWSKYSLTS